MKAAGGFEHTGGAGVSLDAEEMAQPTAIQIVAAGSERGDAALAGRDEHAVSDPLRETFAHERIGNVWSGFRLPGVRQLVRQCAQEQRARKTQLDKDRRDAVFADEEAKDVLTASAFGHVRGEVAAHVPHLATTNDRQLRHVDRLNARRLARA